MACKQQQNTSGHEFIVAQAIIPVAQFDELGDQVRLGISAALSNQVKKKGRHFFGGLLCCVILFCRCTRRANEQGHVIGHTFDLGQILARHTQQSHDDQTGQGACKLGDEVEFILVAKTVDQPVCNIFDLGTHGLHGLGMEHLACQPS